MHHMREMMPMQIMRPMTLMQAIGVDDKQKGKCVKR